MARARPLSAEAYGAVTAVLTEPQMALFNRFNFTDQWHSYRVMCALQAAGHDQPDLLTAALLHDIGKTKLPISVWERSWIVLGQMFLPGRAAAWGQAEAQGWRRPFVVKAQHPAWGAEMAEQVGCTPLTISLIRRHQDSLAGRPLTEEDELLQHLQWADD
ncbi:MAG TPA: HDIG domain-containing protein, partial [Anaerolineae bacterium]|nr:HDIG domain-containing protein [Anaerolineae bacterium]